jgi:methionyl-tRNA formyltransferase
MNTVLLLGLGPTALSALESLAEAFRIVGVVRDDSSTPSVEDEVLQRAGALCLPVFSDVTIDGVERAVIETQPDCVVVSSYDRILPRRILTHSRFLNVHYAPLPQYRGRANVNWAIINSESEAAISVHVLAPGLDAGNVLYQQRVPIDPDDTVGDLYYRLNEIQRQVLGIAVARYISGYEGVPQDETDATYGCTRIPEDGEINWSNSTRQIYALVRALGPPYPGAYTFLAGRPMTIRRASPLENAPRYVGRIPGRVVGRSSREGYADVLTGDGVLRIHEVATGDGGSEPASALIGSTRQTLGLRGADLLARIEMLESRLNQLERVKPDVQMLISQRRDDVIPGDLA